MDGIHREAVSSFILEILLWRIRVDDRYFTAETFVQVMVLLII